MNHTFILGPCLMESEDLCKEVIKTLQVQMKDRDWYFKSSFDKANRTSLGSKRGPGLDKGIELVAALKKEFPEVRFTTDIHETHQCEKLAEIIDLAQIPAFLCRQTDLLVESGAHFQKVNVKKGQWVSPKQTAHFADKVRSKNPEAEVWLTERGTFFGYDTLTVDFSSVDQLKKQFDKVILDCTHSTQKNRDGFTGGDRELSKRFFKAAPIFNYDGVFAEVHPNPDKALSDAESQIELNQLQGILAAFDSVNESAR